MANLDMAKLKHSLTLQLSSPENGLSQVLRHTFGMFEQLNLLSLYRTAQRYFQTHSPTRYHQL